MRPLLVIGSILFLLGIASLFIPIPRKEKHGLDVGGVSLGVETTSHEKIPTAISALLIAGGVVLVAVGARKRQ